MNKKETVFIFISLFLIANLLIILAINFDVNGDSSTDIDDLISLATHYRGTYNATYDFNGDSSVDLFDVVALAKNISLESSVSPFAYDDFSSGDFNGGTGITWTDPGIYFQFATANPPPGYTDYLEMTYNGTPGANFQLNYEIAEAGEGYTHIWLEYYFKAPADYSHPDESPSNNKFFRMHSGIGGRSVGYTNRNKVGSSLSYDNLANNGSAKYYFEYCLDGGGIGPYTSQTPNPGISNFIFGYSPADTWIQLRQEFQLASSPEAADGFYKIWIDGVFIQELTGLSQNSQDPWDMGYFFGSTSADFTENIIIGFGGVKFYDSDPGW